MARQITKLDISSFPDPSIALDPAADEPAIAELCRGHAARLRRWLDQQIGPQDQEPAPPPYDGTVLSACRGYQMHPHSRFRKVKANTRKSYTDSLKVIEATVGKRLIRNLTVIDIQHWYDQWRLPVVTIDDEGNKTVGPERIDRAHDAIAMVKMVLRFNAALRRKDCKQLIDDLEKASSLVSFEKGGARQEEMTYDQVLAFLRTAQDMVAKGLLAEDRARYLSIGVAAQFDLMLRPRDVIGEYPRNAADTEKATRKGADQILTASGDIWTGWFTWERVPGWRWRMRTSKSKYRSAVEFFLEKYSLLFPLLEAVPHNERKGSVVKGEGGQPMRSRTYQKNFRKIARAAGIPDAVWNMDLRASGATEGEEAGAPIELTNAALTHSAKQIDTTTPRYIRRRSKQIGDHADIRSASRTGGKGNA